MLKKKYPLVLIALLVVIYILFIGYANKPPSREQVNKMFGDELAGRKVLAYEVWNNAPASFGIGHCTGESGVLPPQCKSTDIFGQINNKEISILELKFNGELYKYPVSYPGYIIRLNDFNGIIEDHRFLDKDGNIVWK